MCPALLSPFTLTLALSHRGRGDDLPPGRPGHTPLASLRLLAPLSERKGRLLGFGGASPLSISPWKERGK